MKDRRKKMRRNKRGGFLDAMNMVVMIPTFILIAFGIGVLVFGVLNDKLDTTEFDSFYISMYTSQLINTPNCFAYQEPQTKRSDYGVVDQNKLTNQRLIECMQYGEPRRQLPVRMELINLDTGQEQEFLTSSWYEGINEQKTVGREVTMLTPELEEQQALLKITYGDPRMAAR